MGDQYTGEAPTSADEKGRIMVPQNLRAIMDVHDHDTWCATRGFENYIFLFHKNAWDKFLSDNAAAFSGLDSRRSMLRRMFVGGMEKLKRDAQGRLSIPQHLRDYAGIEREAVLIGCGDHLELWNKGAWKKYQEHHMQAYGNLADELLGNGASIVTTGASGS